ncbi:hypothetical protein GCM10009599_30650 [Luteococcus peritonei]
MHTGGATGVPPGRRVTGGAVEVTLEEALHPARVEVLGSRSGFPGSSAGAR